MPMCRCPVKRRKSPRPPAQPQPLSRISIRDPHQVEVSEQGGFFFFLFLDSWACSPLMGIGEIA